MWFLASGLQSESDRAGWQRSPEGRDVLLPQEGETVSQSQMRALTETDRDGGRASSVLGR